MTVMTFPRGTVAAGVFTRSACPSYEVERGRALLSHGVARVQVVNAGNANAFTGQRGRDAVEGVAHAIGVEFDCKPDEVYVSSTGVIGVPLPLDTALRGVAEARTAAPEGWEAAAEAIGTTDTFAKGAGSEALVGKTRIRIAGIAKGSGMIAPDMATMLGYIVTDASIDAIFLQELLTYASDRTFNCITVDGDTSTSDTVMAFATGSAGNTCLTGWDSAGTDAFLAALHEVCLELAQLIVRDGEGATKFIEITVTGAQDDQSARRIGLSIANSPLVKTAIAGGDANWGRVVMAVGKAGEPADRDRLSIAFGGVQAAVDGLPCDDFDEPAAAEHLAGEDIRMNIDLGIGEGIASVWTCDLTNQYIAINADYRS